MQELFNDIINTDGVTGIMLFGAKGELLFKAFAPQIKEVPEQRDWRFFLESMEGMREIDLIFENGRIYIRKIEIGYLVILMALYVPIAMIRLNCDILLPSLQSSKSRRKFRRFFKR